MSEVDKGEIVMTVQGFVILSLTFYAAYRLSAKYRHRRLRNFVNWTLLLIILQMLLVGGIINLTDNLSNEIFSFLYGYAWTCIIGVYVFLPFALIVNATWIGMHFKALKRLRVLRKR